MMGLQWRQFIGKIIFLKLVIKWDYSEVWYWQTWFKSETYFDDDFIMINF